VAPGSILPPPGAGPDYLEHLAKQVPLKRHGDPSDVTSAVLYLLRSDFVTGEVIAVTGGEQLQ
jgi:pteridine reductase